MLISAIVAVAHDHVIGSGNQIPWYLPADLAYFKRTTLDHPIIMGRNTYHSIGRPLPKRTNIVVTRDPYFSAEGVLVAHHLEEAYELALDTGTEEAFIIGGGQIYEQSAADWDKVYITEVDLEVPGEVRFPVLDIAAWRVLLHEAHKADEKNEYDYIFRVLERI
jgi:dihydrofolate reductase